MSLAICWCVTTCRPHPFGGVAASGWGLGVGRHNTSYRHLASVPTALPAPRPPPTSRAGRCPRIPRATHVQFRPPSAPSRRKKVDLRHNRPRSGWQSGRAMTVVTGYGLPRRSRSDGSIRDIAPHSTAIPAAPASKIFESTPNRTDATSKKLRSTARPPPVIGPKNRDPTADSSVPTTDEMRPR